MGRQKKLKKLRASFSTELRDSTNTTSNLSDSLSLEVPRRITLQSCPSNTLQAHFHQAHVSPILSNKDSQSVASHGAITSTPLVHPHHITHMPFNSPLHESYTSPINSQLKSHTPPYSRHTSHRCQPRPHHTPTGELNRPLRVFEEIRSRESFRAMMSRAPPYERYHSTRCTQGTHSTPVCPLVMECVNAPPSRWTRCKATTNHRWPRDILKPTDAKEN